MRKRTGEGEHAFSIELESKQYVKRITMSNEAGDRVVIEGFLGELGELSFVENAMLEIKGVNGTLRMDLNEEEFRKLLSIGEKKSR